MTKLIWPPESPEFIPQGWEHPNVFAFLWADLARQTGSFGYSTDSEFLEMPYETQQEIVNDWITLLYQLDEYLKHRSEKGPIQ